MSFASRRITTPAWAASLPSTIAVWDDSVDTSNASFSIGSSSYSSVGNVFNPSETWLLQGSGSDYEVRLTVTAGSFATGTTGSWLGLGSTRTWGNTASPGTGFYYNLVQGNGLLEIRNAATQIVVAFSALTVRALSTNT